MNLKIILLNERMQAIKGCYSFLRLRKSKTVGQKSDLSLLVSVVRELTLPMECKERGIVIEILYILIFWWLRESL